ncbi:MAG: UPF0280 family protein [Deltaproteobacteria bacterium]|nr:UPF0280 family protein [Deltaproteobacteria bacterium]MBW1929478.1 UPF0280 family protein [Deltaproteobacteria bacterium]MBW2023863.1 UPF0280 family protein [Deltaproteobacteria bacterium]MBW2124152.1 UPF0280 family protein [Deltaproteobacteria bacterium]RLB23874.1 MAG: UPF0280 family protein [Deltaproteobacteria bacterium]
MERSYRKRVRSKGLVSFQVCIKQTDLWVSAERNLERETRDLVLDARNQLETYIKGHASFISTLSPWPKDPLAPPMVKEMIKASRELSVGPMACVAGAIAQKVGEGLLQWSREVVVENGGDIYLFAMRPITVALYAGASSLGNKLGLRLSPEFMPLGVCSSSASIGHSFSAGRADLVTVLSPSACYADGAATAICNMIRTRKDLQRLEELVFQFRGIIGVVAILGETMACWGNIELVKL